MGANVNEKTASGEWGVRGSNSTTDKSGNSAGNTVLPDGLGSDLAYEDHVRRVARVEEQGVTTIVTTTGGAQTITSQPGKRIKGIVCIVAGNLTIYDNTAASGTVVYPTTTHVALDSFKWPIARACQTGYHVVPATAGAIFEIYWE